jgi:hypothetical protein
MTGRRRSPFVNAMTDIQNKPLLSEDPNAGLATPVMDLTAALVVAAICVWILIESLLLPVPAALITAPGLLPFLTAGSLLVMAGVLGAAALRRWHTVPPETNRFELPAEFPRTLLLGAILVVYVAALQFLTISVPLSLAGKRLVVGNFEVASVIVLTTILRMFWGRALWMCLAVAAGWIAFLSLVFRLVFEIQLP